MCKNNTLYLHVWVKCVYLCGVLKIHTMNYTYKYPRPALTADCVIFGYDGDTMKLLLVKRNETLFHLQEFHPSV